MYVLSEVGLQDVEIVLPQSSRSADFENRMQSALQVLAHLEDRDIGLIIADVQAIGFDVLRSTLPEHVVSHDSIHLEVASQFIRGVKGLLAAAATTEIHPDRFFGRVRREAQDYAEGCRFGHTFRGSFGFTIESPLGPNAEPTLDGIEQVPPFERRVVQRIARGLRTFQQAADAQDSDVIAQKYLTEFNANMCDELAEMIENTGMHDVGFEFSLSPEWKPPPDIPSHSTFEVGAIHVELARDAASRLRQQELDRNQTIVGRVVRLKSESDPSNLMQPSGTREILVFWSNPRFGNIHVRILVPPAEYLIAVEAHKSGRLIEVVGKIDRIGRSWRLLEPTHLGIVP
jgi:hypothetical protein